MEKKRWYKSIGNWLFILVLILLVPLLVANVYIMVSSKIDKDKVPNIFGYKPFIVLSGSMESSIRKGDLVITKMIDPSTLKENDIIAFRDVEGTVTTHRIIELVENEGINYFVTKGDNNTTQDLNLVEYDDVEGVYIGRIPNVGNLMNSFADPMVIVIMVAGITVIFAVGFMISNKRSSDKEREEFLEYKRQKEAELQKNSKLVRPSAKKK